MSGWAQRDAERQEDEHNEQNKSCITCGKDDNKTGESCPTRTGCHFPDYVSWQAPGAENEYTGCTKCSSWAEVKIGRFCPNCGEKL